MLLLRLISFHILIYASIVLQLGMLPESAPRISCTCSGRWFAFSLSYLWEKGERLVPGFGPSDRRILMGMLAKQTVTNIAGGIWRTSPLSEDVWECSYRRPPEYELQGRFFVIVLDGHCT